MREKLRRAETLLVQAESGLLVLLLSFMVLLAFYQVAQRQLFGTGFLWGDSLLRRLVLWVGFLGAAIAAADEKHFAWEAASHKLKPYANAAAVVILGFLVHAAWRFFHEEFAQGKILFLGIPEWAFALAMPVGFSLVLFHTAMRIANRK